MTLLGAAAADDFFYKTIQLVLFLGLGFSKICLKLGYCKGDQSLEKHKKQTESRFVKRKIRL